MCDEGMLTYKEAHERARPRGEGPGQGDVDRKGARGGEEALRRGAQGRHRHRPLGAARARGQLGAARAGAGAHRDAARVRDRQARRLRGHDPHPPRQEPEHEGRLAARAGREAAAGPASTTSSPDAITHVLALGAAVPVDAEPLGQAKVVTIAAHVGVLTELATVLLPSTSWAEHSGTYVNAKGMRQVSEKALEPQGASKPGWRQVVGGGVGARLRGAVDEAEADPGAAHRKRRGRTAPAGGSPRRGVRSKP